MSGSLINEREEQKFSFSLDSGEMVDASIIDELISQAAAFNAPKANQLLEVGFRLGDCAINLLKYFPSLNITLIDENLPTLERAKRKIESFGSKNSVITVERNIFDVDLDTSRFDLVVVSFANFYLNHTEDWELLLNKLYKSLRTGGSIWVTDFVNHSNPYIQTMMWKRYGEHLIQLKDQDYRNAIFSYLEKGKMPHSLNYQLDLLKKSGFKEIDLLHKNAVFAAYGGIKA